MLFSLFEIMFALHSVPLLWDCCYSSFFSVYRRFSVLSVYTCRTNCFVRSSSVPTVVCSDTDGTGSRTTNLNRA
jgi:hypothetical protein